MPRGRAQGGSLPGAQRYLQQARHYLPGAQSHSPGARRQQVTALALQGLAVVLYGLHLYVAWFLPASPPNTVPDQASVETAWWGLWPVHYAAPGFVLLGGVGLALLIAASWWRIWKDASGPSQTPEQPRSQAHSQAVEQPHIQAPEQAHSQAPEQPHSQALEQAHNQPYSQAHSQSYSQAYSQPQSESHEQARARSGTVRLLLILATGGLVAAFYLFPLAHTRWGDAYMLANGIAFPDAALRLTHSWQAPLDVFLHSEVWRLLHTPLGWEDAVPAYRLLSPLAGLLYLLAALGLGALLARTEGTPAWLTYGLLATLGLMQLFFGYVENYAFAAAGVLAYLWLGLRVLSGESPLWLAAALLGVTNATHPSTVILAPSLLFLGWWGWRTGTQTLARSVIEIALPVLLIGGATFVWMEGSGHGLYALLNTDRPGGGDARWFVPLWATSTRWERYTMFSWPHLRDWLNQQLLVAPAVLPALGVVAASLWAARREPPATPRRGQQETQQAAPGPHTVERSVPPPGRQEAVGREGEAVGHGDEAVGRGATVWFLAVAGGFYLLFTWVWNPDYGGQRDWDLFSLAALPPTVLLAVLLPRALPQRDYLRAGALPLLLVQGWHTAAWIFQNTLPWEWPD